MATRNTNLVRDPAAIDASQARFTSAAQARNPLYKPTDAAGFNVEKALSAGGYKFGWQDPVAQEIYREMYTNQPGYGSFTPERALESAKFYENEAGNVPKYVTSLDPRNWGNAFGGATMDKMAAEYQKRKTATGAGVVAPNVGSGSSFSLSPDILGKMWR